ncbi:MAG: hypothetical protein HQ498_13480 [Pseudohongiella sp.]|nr:hypothetical protein [Pseudohongiella sp.]
MTCQAGFSGASLMQYGPFVMSSNAQIEQAIRDYNAGRLAGAVRSA